MLDDNGYWDDLDLVRYCLSIIRSRENVSQEVDFYYVRDRYEKSKVDRLSSSYEGDKQTYLRLKEDCDSILKYKFDYIFCDEAQDFTAVEIELLLNMSTYIHFDLEKWTNIPIIFAGDPNQTVIPTGFKWNRLKQIFDSSFEKKNIHIGIKDKQLTYNYRSQTKIVGFANFVQFFRSCLLKSSEAVPQNVWFSNKKSVDPTYIELEEFNNIIGEYLNKFPCIITGQDGEYDFDEDGNTQSAENNPELYDDFLKNLGQKYKLYTAISSKGQEFSNVILYRFVDFLPGCFEKIFDQDQALDDIELFELSHFFTKLYIAVSRTKDRLLIVDSKDNFDRFWKYFEQSIFTNNLWSKLSDFDEWNTHINYLVKYNSNDSHIFDENYDSELIALDLFQSAFYNESSKDMRRASQYFAEANKYTKKIESLAYAYRYDFDFVESGRLFDSIGFTEKANESYWIGRCWDKLSICDDGLYKNVGLYMTQSKDILAFIAFIDGKQLYSKINRSDDTWNDVLVKLQKDYLEVESDYWLVIINFFEKLQKLGFSILRKIVAGLSYSLAKQNNDKSYYQKAVDIWNSMSSNDYKIYDYNEAMEILSDSVSDKIDYMNRNNKVESIVNQYSDIDSINTYKLTSKAVQIVFDNLLSDGSYFDKAFSYSRVLKNPKSGLEMLFSKHPILFLEKYVFAEDIEERFSEWVIDRVEIGYDYKLFNHDFTIDIMKKILTLDEKYLHRFAVLRNSYNHLLIKKTRVNVSYLLDQLCPYLLRKPDKFLASSFIDLLFGTGYSYIQANKYAKAFSLIIEKNHFNRNDFLYSVVNKYFERCHYSLDDVYYIHNNIRTFIENKFDSVINSNTEVSDEERPIYKSLCNFYKNVLPFKAQPKADGQKDIDILALRTFYNKVSSSIKFSYLKPFLKVKNICDRITKKNLSVDRFFDVLRRQKVSFRDFCDDLDKSDTISVVRYLIPNPSIDSVLKDGFVYLAKSIHMYDIGLREFDFKDPDIMRKRILSLTDNCVDNYLSRRFEHLNEKLYFLKLLSFVWEKVMDNRSAISQRYEYLSYRLPEVIRGYFRNRSLLYASDRNGEFRNVINNEFVPDCPIITLEELQSDVVVINGPTYDILGVEIQIDERKHRVIFFDQDGIPTVIVNSGRITVQNASIEQAGNVVRLQSNFEVEVKSNSVVQILADSKHYVINY